MSRKRQRSGRQHRQPAELASPDWIDVGGRLMFIVGYTPGGAPYGVYEYEDEMDHDFGDNGNPLACQPPF